MLSAISMMAGMLAEIGMILVCLQIAFKQNLKFDRYMLGVIATDVLLYMLINFRIISMICAIPFYGLLIWYSYCSFKQGIKRTLIRVVVGFSIGGAIQCLTLFAVGYIFRACNPQSQIMGASICSFVIACVIKESLPLLKQRKKKKIRGIGGKGIYGLMMLYAVILAVVIVFNYTQQRVPLLWIATLGTVMLLITYSLYYLDLAQMDIDKKNYELEVQRIYGGAYEELLGEIRRRQHDYKNQLAAVYSMHLVAGSMDELIDMQKKYMDELQDDSRYDSILTSCENPILAGYLYSRFLSCEKDGISVDYDIHIEQAKCRFATHEIIEILGILITNACESFGDEQAGSRCIKVELRENHEKILFSVSNPAGHIKNSEIEKMFAPGYSSKGENRGIGLPRVAELVKIYKAELKVTNVSRNGENWIEFTVEAQKE